ncbi:chloramphenicol O-acetyltransferase type A [Parabacteroides sp. PF5-5]|uniref:chloramphenicol acetyltransferase n=1 Tax=unclassified Parabacteroides TaxID=2649774 RepID=UPI0024759A18|nr:MULTISPECIES: chloramphenicol acetyltransferase [unclassified Parabacteroides]MDH6305904.1 chloramphenicol O-acetyltransferase type A [Parabacteroides sp. PH5-39]MDH6317283.1 chloramphenicol O-acetyltransferase type A [Parabacteroides sp. PF5-13]MDH6320491.1 chloramphenicol O-acetyltransferase type A [Parabacteroides sp. PH5-13]MDH6324347.1 chloramphenicol O-acetyltransferase type A [Parabacteroides sp. PH5-8]MDH6328543.1 chloramphenicol O-acetyltransferase type A [Parabacteroides sp. PH5-4
MTKQIIDINTWKRREHYQFFKDYQEPFWSITANVDCSKAYQYAKENNLSFFLYYMYRSLMTVNSIEEFRYRIEDNNVVCYNKIHGSTTALNAIDMFAFAFLPYADTFEDFYAYAQKEIEKIKSINNMNIDENGSRPDVIHYSTIPWVSFTALTNERNYAIADSIPKITFGKYTKEGNKMLLPVALNVHHGLMDGFHAGQYFELFQELLNKNE